MRAVTYQEPGRIAVEDRPEPEIQDPSDAVIKVDAAGICGSDLHVYHATHRRWSAASSSGTNMWAPCSPWVTGSPSSRRATGSSARSSPRADAASSAAGALLLPMQKLRVFGFGRALGDLPGTQADQVLVPNAHLTLRRISPGLSRPRRSSPAT